LLVRLMLVRPAAKKKACGVASKLVDPSLKKGFEIKTRFEI